MGRSQVLYNRTKGRFRNKVRNQTQQQQPSHNNDQHPRGYHDPPRQETGDSSQASYEHADSSHKKRSRSRSTIGQNTTINESEMMLLASSAAPQYYIEDDSSTIFGSGLKGKNKAVTGSLTDISSSSSLDISSLEATLLTCVSISDRLKLPSHVAQTLQKEGSPVVVTTTNVGFSPARSPPSRSTGEETDSEEIIRNARIRKHLLGESPTKSSPPPSNLGSAEFAKDGIRQDDSFLVSLTADDEDGEDVIRPSDSGIRERGRANLPAAPSLVYKTHELPSMSHDKVKRKKKEMDDASYSIGPDKIKATEEGYIEVRIKKKVDDDAFGISREFDVDRYAIIEGDDEDSSMTSDQSDKKQPMRNIHVPVKSFPKARNKVAAVSARAGNLATSGKLDPPTTTRDPPAGTIPPLQADPSDDSEMLENWLDGVVGGPDAQDAASSAAVHPMEATTGRDTLTSKLGTTKNQKAASEPPVSIVQGSSTMPKEVTIPQRPMVGGIASNSTAVTDTRPTSSPMEEEDVEDTLESWLDDVIM